MNIRNLILFVTTIIIYGVVWGAVVKMGLDLGHSPTSFVLMFSYVGSVLCTAIMWPMFESMYKDIFKED